MKSPKKTGLFIGIILALCVCIYAFTGFFVVQPIGSIPDGVTVWYIRTGVNLDFIESPDGFLQKHGDVTLLGRAMVLSTVYEQIEDKIILKLPYQHWMYKISTGGVEYEN